MHDRGQEHRLAVFAGDADGGVVTLRLFLRLGALREDALGKVDPLAQLREHRKDVRVFALDHGVELSRKRADLCPGFSSEIGVRSP